MLEEQNVTSTIFVNNKFFESFLSEPIAIITGFSECFGKKDMPLLLHYYPEEKDRNLGCDYETLMFSLEKINNIDNQFLSFISLNTNHTPLKIQNSFDFFAPEILKPKEIETVSSQLDLMPTFIDFMGLETEYTALGTSLLRNKESFALVREGSLVGIITDRGYLKHSLIHRLEFGKVHPGADDNYLDLLEDRLLAWDNVAYELVSNNRWSP